MTPIEPAQTAPVVLTLNGGSSSIRFAAFRGRDARPVQMLAGRIDRIGVDGTTLKLVRANTLATAPWQR